MKNILMICIALMLSSCGYNSILSSDEDVKSTWAEVENQYKRRMDLMGQLIKVVKGAAKYEKETLIEVVDARAKATSTQINVGDLNDPAKFKQFQKAQDQLSGAISRLLMTVERYPELKAVESFQQLQVQIEGTENRIAVARKRYIEAVATFNKLIRMFPSSLTAKYILKMTTRETFSAPEGAENPPKIDLDL